LKDPVTELPGQAHAEQPPEARLREHRAQVSPARHGHDVSGVAGAEDFSRRRRDSD
jgi:hypothetical protein